MWDWFFRSFPLTRRRSSASAAEAMGRELWRMLPRCPVCMRSSRGHRATLVASAVHAEATKRFLEAHARRDWAALRTLHEFDVAADNFLSYAVACPSGSGVLLTYVDPAELFAGKEVFAPAVVDAKEWQTLTAGIADEHWHMLER